MGSGVLVNAFDGDGLVLLDVDGPLDLGEGSPALGLAYYPSTSLNT